MTIIPPGIRSPNVLAAARWSAAISASIGVLIIAVLMGLMIQDKLQGPLVTKELEKLRADLHASPSDNALKDKYRQADARIRFEFFTRHTRMARGNYLLLAAGIALVLSVKAIRQAEKRGLTLVELTAVRPAPTAANWYAVGSVSLAVLALFGAGSALAFRVTSATKLLPEDAPAITIVFPDEATLRANWPVFRGWGGSGIVAGTTDLPHWDAAKNESILWKSPVPGGGQSSPIVWRERIFLTGFANQPELYCFSVSDGKLLWTSPITPTLPDAPSVNEDTGLAAPTPATDGTLVYAIFASGDIAAFDFTGKRVWQRFLGKPESDYGYAASLSVNAGNVIVQWDMGKGERGNGSVLMAIDGATGRNVWVKPRATPATWASPIVAAGRIFAMGRPNISAYEAATGAEIWHAALNLNDDVACTPAFVDNHLYVANVGGCVAGISNAGTGDVSESAVPWKKLDEGLPDISSPTSDGKLVWTIAPGGNLFCFDAAAGTKIYEETLGAPVHASPLLLGEFLLITDTVGKTHKLSTGRAFKEVATSSLGENVSASPAVAAGKLFIRAKKNLYCIGTK